MPSQQRTFHVPHPDVLAALGLVAVRQGHLEYVLRMTIKTLLGKTIREALQLTEYLSAGRLRLRLEKAASQKLGPEDYARLSDWLDRCRTATGNRDRVLHGTYAADIDGTDPRLRLPNDRWREIPSLTELEALANELRSLTYEINEARFYGFIASALKRAALTPVA